jgi:hypothetical protein
MRRAWHQSLRMEIKRALQPTLLRIRDIDRSRLAPDHERFQIHYLGDRPKQRRAAANDAQTARLLNTARRVVDLRYAATRLGGRPSRQRGADRYCDGVEVLRRMPSSLRQDVARHLSETVGEPVMHYGQISPERIEVGSPLPWLGDDPWLLELADYAHLVPEDDGLTHQYVWTAITSVEAWAVARLRMDAGRREDRSSAAAEGVT